MKHRLITTLALAALACATVAATAMGGGHGRLYQFRGTLLATGTNSVQLQVEGGNHDALKAMIGQSQNQSFSVDSKTEFLGWSVGVPHVVSINDLHAGDKLTINVRAQAGSSLTQVEANAANVVSDRGNGSRDHDAGPLYLYVGTVAGGQAGGHIALHVTGGNWRGLMTMLGQPLDQVFTYDSGTIFLLWQGKVPTVIDPSQLKAGDRITVRLHAPRGSTLAQAEAHPAGHVGDHEPGNPQTQN